MGAVFFEGQRAENIGEAAVVVISSAIKKGNPELEEARRRGLPVVRRIAPVSASPDALELDVDLVSGIANFSRYVGRAGVLVPVPEAGDGSAAAPAAFRLGGG